MIKKTNAIFYALVVILILLTSVISCCIPSNSNTLNLLSIEPITLDPAISSETTSHLFIGQLFGGLVKLDDDSKIKPDIAESWTISDDGRVYTFKLREDVTFHNGKEVTAQDFEYSWERACNPETGSETAATYLNDIVGVQEVLDGTVSEIAGAVGFGNKNAFVPSVPEFIRLLYQIIIAFTDFKIHLGDCAFKAGQLDRFVIHFSCDCFIRP